MNLGGWSDVQTPCWAQVLAIVALVGDLLYLRPNVAAVLVHIDLDGGRPHPSSIVALAAGREVASSWGATLYAAFISHDAAAEASSDSTGRATTHIEGIDQIEADLARAGADKVVVAMTDSPVMPLWASVGSAWQGIVDHLRPRLVLFGADSPSATELGPRTGARIGARLLVRARTFGGHDIELRDRDGGYARSSDTGATVAFVGRAHRIDAGQEDIDVVVLAPPGGADARIELAGTGPAELSHTRGALIVVGDDVDAQVIEDAKRLATQLGGEVVAAARIDHTSCFAPDLCVVLGNAQVDLAGASSLVKVGATATKNVDAALPGPIAKGIADLAKRLEEIG